MIKVESLEFGSKWKEYLLYSTDGFDNQDRGCSSSFLEKKKVLSLLYKKSNSLDHSKLVPDKFKAEIYQAKYNICV